MGCPGVNVEVSAGWGPNVAVGCDVVADSVRSGAGSGQGRTVVLLVGRRERDRRGGGESAERRDRA